MRKSQFVLMPACLGTVAMLLCVAPSEARPRGEPGTDDRKAYCFQMYLDCVDGGSRNAMRHFPTTLAPREIAPSALSVRAQPILRGVTVRA